MEAELEQPARLGRAPGRPAGRPLRHDPAADRGRRPDDRRLLVRRRARRPRRASRSSAGAAAAPGSASGSSGPAVTLFSDPAYPGLECAPFVVAASSGNDAVGLRQRPPAGAHRLDPRRHAGRAAARPAHTAGAHRPAGDAGDRQPGARGRRRAPARIDDLVAGTERGLLLTCLWYIREVDPQTPAAHRPDPRRRLPRRERRDHRRGQQLPLQREPGRPAAPLHATPRATVPSFSREWGDDYFSRTATPALRVPDFNMSSVSQATVGVRAQRRTIRKRGDIPIAW